ncbi:MAG: phosphatase PAP2 family protein [Gammaproteobacteria bacterium]
MLFNQFVKMMTRPYFAVFWLLLVGVSYFYFDKPIALYMAHLQNTGMTNFFEAVTFFGISWPYLFVIAALLVVSFIFKKKQLFNRFIFIFTAIISAGIICDILKIILGRARPDELFQHNMYGFYFLKFNHPMLSFPSGHTMTATAVAIALSYCLPRYFVLWFSMVLLVGLSRIVLTAHYLSDVLMGLYLSTIIVVVLFKMMESIMPDFRMLKDKSYA